MIKLLPVGVVVLLMIGALIYIRVTNQPSLLTPLATVDKIKPLNGSEESRIAILEESVVAIAKKIGGIQGENSSPANAAVLEARIKTLEDAVSILQRQLNTQNPGAQPSPATTTTTTNTITITTKKPPLYIPLGAGGTFNDQNWLALESYEITIDPADYEGYSSMQLEVNMRFIESVGTIYARLYSVPDSGGVLLSEVSTTATKFTQLTSNGFKLSPGKKAYRLQVKSTTGFEAQLQNARIKVNF